MSTVAVQPVTIPTGLRGFAWQCRNNPRRELWFAWWSQIAFYNVFTLSFFILTRTEPPESPAWSAQRVTQWIGGHHGGLIIGFALIFLVGGFTSLNNALIAYSIRRMSVSRAFAYSYLLMYALAAVPGMLLTCLAFTVAAMRPDREPRLQVWLYDFGFLSFIGTMGVFLIGSLIWMLAILLDRNGVYPKWFGYLNLCNALTEVVVSPAWVFRHGVLAWNGLIAWWIDVVVFGIYTGVFIMLLRSMIQREDFKDGPLPSAAEVTI